MRLILELLTGLVLFSWIARVIFGMSWLKIEYGFLKVLGIEIWKYELAKIKKRGQA